MLRAASKPVDPHLVAKLYQTLALYYAHYGDPDQADRYGRRAFNDYELLNDSWGIAAAACTLAIIYRMGPEKNLKKAEYYIQRAYRMAKQHNYTKEFANILYEEGVSYYRSDGFGAALNFFQDALAIYEAHDAPYHIAMTHHSIALVFIHTGKFDEAEAALRRVRQAWAEQGNHYELVNVHYAEGDLELKRGNRGLARRILEDTLDQAWKLPNTPAREALIASINQHIAEHF